MLTYLRYHCPLDKGPLFPAAGELPNLGSRRIKFLILFGRKSGQFLARSDLRFNECGSVRRAGLLDRWERRSSVRVAKYERVLLAEQFHTSKCSLFGNYRATGHDVAQETEGIQATSVLMA